MTRFSQTPVEVGPPERWVQRRAKLFETGEYADKGVTITRGTLETLCRSFGGPVPIFIEHAESPLELGYLTHVEQEGDELFGTISLTPEADALVERSEAHGLSLGLSPELDTIREVSLVRHPRVSDARLFFVGTLEPGPDWRRRYADLEATVLRERADQECQALLEAGKLTPAQVPFAAALLACDQSVTFDGATTPIGRLVRRFLDAQPPGLWRGEFAPAQTHSAAANLMLPEEAAFYQRYFPEVSLEQIAARRTA